MNTLSVVHDVLRRQVREGDFCIDATAGKGRDTALLCRLTGENGRVLAFDVQEDAVRQTRELLAKEHLSAEVYLDSHANMAHYANRRRWTASCSISAVCPAETRQNSPPQKLHCLLLMRD